MADPGKLTIITVVLNAAQALQETIESVRKNVTCPYDYIIIDGGSTDGTLDVIRKHESSLTYWLSEPDQGVYDAMNKGWRLADPASCILYLGAGDLLLQLPAEELPCYGIDEVLYGDVLLERGQSFRSHADFRLRLYNSLHHQALIVPKWLSPEPPFNLAFKVYADFDFNQRLLKEGARFRYASGLQSFAAPGGLTEVTHVEEMVSVVQANYGLFFAMISKICFTMVRCIPFLKIFRPIH